MPRLVVHVILKVQVGQSYHFGVIEFFHMPFHFAIESVKVYEVKKNSHGQFYNTKKMRWLILGGGY